MGIVLGTAARVALERREAAQRTHDGILPARGQVRGLEYDVKIEPDARSSKPGATAGLSLSQALP